MSSEVTPPFLGVLFAKLLPVSGNLGFHWSDLCENVAVSWAVPFLLWSSEVYGEGAGA